MIKYDFMHLCEHPVLWQTDMCISIGVFDGLHIGHLDILGRNVKMAREHGWKTMAIIFDKNPKMFMKHQPQLNKLTTDMQNEEIFTEIGIDYLVVIDFSLEFSKLSPKEFLAFICSFCRVKAMVVGEDFRCGAPDSNSGPVQLQEHLSRLAPEAIVYVPPFVRTAQGEITSSTLVRQKLLKGALEEVQSMLGRPYALDLVAYSSKFTENGLLYRTASFIQLLPMPGVYEGTILLSDGQTWQVQAQFDDSTLLITSLEEGMWDTSAVRTKSLSLAKRSVL